MKDSNSMICPDCNLPMVPVELRKVPVENLIDFLGNTDNKLEENWYWCSRCDSYDQSKTPTQLSPEAENLRQMIDCYTGLF